LGRSTRGRAGVCGVGFAAWLAGVSRWRLASGVRGGGQAGGGGCFVRAVRGAGATADDSREEAGFAIGEARAGVRVGFATGEARGFAGWFRGEGGVVVLAGFAARDL
jgi:hypothetical protein